MCDVAARDGGERENILKYFYNDEKQLLNLY